MGIRMIIQPRGYKRKYTGAALMLSIRRKLDQIAAVNNVSRSFVQATILAKALGIKEQPDYEVIARNQRRNHSGRSRSEVIRGKFGKRHTA